MDRDTPDIVVNFLAFASVKPSSNIDPERTNFFDDCAGAADCAPRPVEGDEEAVTGRVGLASAKAHNRSVHENDRTCQNVSTRRAFSIVTLAN
jgi:hypothetical protein